MPDLNSVQKIKQKTNKRNEVVKVSRKRVKMIKKIFNFLLINLLL